MQGIRWHVVRSLKTCTADAFFNSGGFIMKKFTALINYFSKNEILLWTISELLIIVSFCLFDRGNYLTLLASVLGVTSLIFSAKGNPFGQFLMVIFSVLYGIISYSFAYYGEMITYLGMTLPMSVFALISWMKNPYNGNKSEVRINQITKCEYLLMWMLTAVVTAAFYFILEGLHTSNIIPSTISVTTSFLAVYLSFRRSPFFALAYAANDIILVVLWVLASISDIRYIAVAVCFAAFLANDIYGFINWRKMQKKQEAQK